MHSDYMRVPMMELASQWSIESGNLNKQHGQSVDPIGCACETSVQDQGYEDTGGKFNREV